LLWLGGIISGTVAMLAYSIAPGRAGSPPAAWPVASRLSLAAGRPTLVLFVHPRCPCSRASLGELAVLMAHCQTQLTAHVLFLQPEGTTESWATTDLWRAACIIPGVTVHGDAAGVEARRFHSETSGHTVLYDRDGRLVFQGGITVSRGHSGDNPGRGTVENWLAERRPAQINTPVFGCSLFEADCQEEGSQCRR